AVTHLLQPRAMPERSQIVRAEPAMTAKLLRGFSHRPRGAAIVPPQPMNPFLILLIGMAVVIGGILLCRLHPFLALIAAALTVAALTRSDVPVGERVA